MSDFVTAAGVPVQSHVRQAWPARAPRARLPGARPAFRLRRLATGAALVLVLVFGLVPRVQGATNYRSIGTAGPLTNQGTITLTVGSAIVTKVGGTGWKAAPSRGRGDRLSVGGNDYMILSVNTNDLLMLSVPAVASFSGTIYTIARQFTTLPLWENCIDGPTAASCTFFKVTSASLVADNRKEVGIAYDDTVFTSTLTISGSTTDATHDITLTADPGHRHLGIQGNGVVLDYSVGTSVAITIVDGYVTVEWLEIRASAVGGDKAFSFSSVAVANKLVIRNCLIHDISSDNYPIFFQGDRDVDIYNNTIYDFDKGVRSLAATNPGVLLRNNVVYATGGSYSVPALNAASSNNLSTDGTAASVNPGGNNALWNNVPIGALMFVSAPTNLHILSGSRAQNNAADLSSSFSIDCLNGYFVAPAFDSLAESLLKVEGRGAIASFSPSGLSLDGPAHQYHRALMAEITGGQHQRLGDALLAAQRAYAQTGLMPELLSVYHLSAIRR